MALGELLLYITPAYKLRSQVRETEKRRDALPPSDRFLRNLYQGMIDKRNQIMARRPWLRRGNV